MEDARPIARAILTRRILNRSYIIASEVMTDLLNSQLKRIMTFRSQGNPQGVENIGVGVLPIEMDRSSEDQETTTIGNKRPDFLCWTNGVLLLKGEEDVDFPVAHGSEGGLEISEHLKDWDNATLTKNNEYTVQSDLYQFGKMGGKKF
ncbi:6527_t:CDS:2 [Funneliformis caledonium]|uniref:6527_t:CDS:1 n=1 Tax=Funneliformis caledonium TaxID=1117310 RepID=A0A9N8ZDC3_9GLOM|nr:6527_t:CDS:2 [Funneliformis caledonium]